MSVTVILPLNDFYLVMLFSKLTVLRAYVTMSVTVVLRLSNAFFKTDHSQGICHEDNILDCVCSVFTLRRGCRQFSLLVFFILWMGSVSDLLVPSQPCFMYKAYLHLTTTI